MIEGVIMPRDEEIGIPPDGSFFTFVDDTRCPPDLWMWGQDKWTQSIDNCVKYHHTEDLNDAWIALSAQDILGQPAMIELVPTEITEGDDKGLWVLKIKVHFMSKVKS